MCYPKIMKYLAGFLTVVLLVACLAATSYCDAGTGNDVSARIDNIQQSLDDGTGSAQLWWYGWVGFYSAATALPLAVALTTDNKTLQVTSGVAAGESLIGLGGMLIFSFPPRSAAAELRSMPENTPEERMKKLSVAETLLKESSDSEMAGTSWVQHSLGVLVNAAGALVIWQVYGNRIKQAGGTAWEQALIAFVAGTAVSEVQIWTEPTRAISDEKEYTSGHPAPVDARFMILPSGNGLTFAAALRF